MNDVYNRFKLKFKKLKRLTLKLLMIISITFFVSTISLIILMKYVNPPITVFMFFKSDVNNIKYKWVPINKISPNLIKAVLVAEDKNFPNHFGFDFGAINAAINDWLWGKKIRGGSTITQQTAKNLFLWEKPGIIKKIIESYFTLLLEIFWSKERILEVYLNIIETQKDKYGMQVACKHYFNKNLNNLSIDEAVELAAKIPNPLGTYPEIIKQNEARIHAENDKYDCKSFISEISE